MLKLTQSLGQHCEFYLGLAHARAARFRRVCLSPVSHGVFWCRRLVLCWCRGRPFSGHFLRTFLTCVHYTDLSASQSTAARATSATSATAAAASRVWTASATGPRGKLARLLSGPPGGGYAPLSFSALNLVVHVFCTGLLDYILLARRALNANGR